MRQNISEALLAYVEGLQRHDVERVGATLSEGLAFISATRFLDKSQFLDMLRALYAGFPDWTYHHNGIEDRGQGNYAIKWHQTGTHTGTWNMPGMAPIFPTNKRVEIAPHYFFYRVANGKLVLIFPEPKQGGAPRAILEQIGVTSPAL